MHTARRAELEKRRQQKQKRSLAFTAGGATCLVAVGVLAILLLRGRPSNDVTPFGANIIPQTVLMSLTLPTDGGPWRQLDALGTPETQKTWKDRLKSFEADFLTPFGLTYEKDVRPWVGAQATLAILSPAQEDVAKVGAHAAVWLLPLRDAQQARAVLGRMAANSPRTRKYKDVDVQTFQGAEGKIVSVAVLEERLLIATNGDMTLNQMIDTYRGAPSLAQTPRFQEALNTIRNESAFGQLYVNFPIAAAGILQNPGRKFSKANLERFQSIQGFGSTIAIQGDKLDFKAISWLKPDAKTKLKGINQPHSLARLLPNDTVLMSAGASFQQAWKDYSEGTESQAIANFNPNEFQASLKNLTDIDFEKEFVSWMDGEFVAAIVPATDQAKQGVALTLLVKARERTQVDKAFQRLDTAMRDRHNLLLAESKVNNRTVTTWKVPPNFSLASHGWLDGNVAFFTFGAPIANRITGPVDSPLIKAALFKDVTQTSLDPNSGQFFADLQRTSALRESSPLLSKIWPELPPDVLKFNQGIDGIGGTSAVQNEWSTRYDLVVKLKR
jgi:Protein of unknown function (DUF3352)